MKKSIYTFATILTFITGTALLSSCGSRERNESESTEQHDMDGHDHDTMAEATFACPMHPEVTGKKGDKCSKCGMFLTKSVDDSKEVEEYNHKMDSVTYTCPMHPNEKGIKGGKCSTCNMDLVAYVDKSAMHSCKHKARATCAKCSKEGSKCTHKAGENCAKCKKA